MLEAVQLPAGVAHLDAGLAHVEGDSFAHCGSVLWGGLERLRDEPESFGGVRDKLFPVGLACRAQTATLGQQNTPALQRGDNMHTPSL